jgi:hypothetical protein
LAPAAELVNLVVELDEKEQRDAVEHGVVDAA